MTQGWRSLYPQALTHRLQTWVPPLRQEIWILAVGRLLLHLGQGFTLVYASVFFVNQLGFSATQVGIAMGSGSIVGVLGRFLAGSLSDAPFCGRKGTLVLATLACALASFCLAATQSFLTLMVGNLLLGLGIGLYWPAALASVADYTTVGDRNEAYAVTRLADSIGMGTGALLAGQAIAMSGNYRALFVAQGISYFVVLALIYWTISEAKAPHQKEPQAARQWLQALRDRAMIVWLGANVFFTTYDALVTAAMPLYLTNFVPGGRTDTGLGEQIVGFLFFWHIFVKAIAQMPIARWLSRFAYADAVLLSLIFWSSGFIFTWMTGVVPAWALVPAAVAMALLALAKTIYLPAAASLVSDLAPETSRGVYFSLESQCWALGYFVGPTLGGWALDRSPAVCKGFWLAIAASAVLSVGILLYLKRELDRRQTEVSPNLKPATHPQVQ
ncbi:MAG: MFS transporter [Coleofasciculaceae cyanobacterium SM2_3_26]|nr:MFS transporter [Coleofasciculaceae cyanobacterium SM2_3_26]